jgi:hypothetical protein
VSGRRLLSGHSALSDVACREPGALRSGRFSAHFTIRAGRTERSRPGRQCETPALVPRGLRRSNGKSMVPCPTNAAWSCRMRRTGGQSTSDPFLGRKSCTDEHAIRFVSSGADQQHSRFLADIAHSFDSADNQVKHHLLELDPISSNDWQVVRKCVTHRSEGAPFGQPSEARQPQPRLIPQAEIGLAPRQVLRPS